MAIWIKSVMVAIFSIHPNYSELILSGIKTVEFRKRRCVKPVDKIVIYATAPVSKIVGEVSVVKETFGSLDELWPIAKRFGCLNDYSFFSYFKGKRNAVAYFLNNPRKYDRKISLFEIGIRNAPQSFCYISDQSLEILSSLSLR